MIAYVLPTRNRGEHLTRTLASIGSLPAHVAEVIVVDNASDPPCGGACVPIQLDNGLPVRVVQRDRNDGASARNAGVACVDRSNEWIVMLDDDSAPATLGHLSAIRDAAPDVCAIQAEIRLPRARTREAGGLPEVFIGCGVAIRRDAFQQAKGYDRSFGYYAEEYDLSAKMLLDGGRVTLDRRFEVDHDKTEEGRDMDAILRRLVRNNAWVMARYAPGGIGSRLNEVRRVISRYGAIAMRERAERGYLRGLGELSATLWRQPRRAMPTYLWDRFTGLAQARASLDEAWTSRPFGSACLVEPGKNAGAIGAALRELGVGLTRREHEAEALVIGTLSPGPLLDAWERRAGYDERVVSPWASLTRDAHTDESGAFVIEAA